MSDKLTTHERRDVEMLRTWRSENPSLKIEASSFIMNTFMEIFDKHFPRLIPACPFCRVEMVTKAENVAQDEVLHPGNECSLGEYGGTIIKKYRWLRDVSALAKKFNQAEGVLAESTKMAGEQ